MFRTRGDRAARGSRRSRSRCVRRAPFPAGRGQVRNRDRIVVHYGVVNRADELLGGHGAPPEHRSRWHRTWFPAAGPWASFHGTAAQMGDLGRVARTFRIIDITRDATRLGVSGGVPFLALLDGGAPSGLAHGSDTSATSAAPARREALIASVVPWPSSGDNLRRGASLPRTIGVRDRKPRTQGAL
jgi:hypothetical protein